MDAYEEYGLRPGRPKKADGPRPKAARYTFTATPRIAEILERMTRQNPHLSQAEIMRIVFLAGAARLPARLQHPLPIHG